jgi:chromosome segregation ATPase
LDGFEHEISTLSNENEKIKQEKDTISNKLGLAQEKLKESHKKKESENEGLYEKIKILQNTLDVYSNKSNQSEELAQKLEKQIEDFKIENSDLKAKINDLVYEMEINYKNVKNNFVLEKNIKDLTEENEKLDQKIIEFQGAEDYKLKYMQVENYAKEIEEKLNFAKNTIESLNNENKKLSNENFEKFQKINSLEGELKIKTHKIDEIEKEKNKLKKSFEDADAKIKNFEYMIKTINSNNENQIREFKKEIDKLVKASELQKNEINQYKTQIEVF